MVGFDRSLLGFGEPGVNCVSVSDWLMDLKSVKSLVCASLRSSESLTGMSMISCWKGRNLDLNWRKSTLSFACPDVALYDGDLHTPYKTRHDNPELCVPHSGHSDTRMHF